MSWRGFGAFALSALPKGRKANSIVLLRHREGYYAASFRIVRGALPEYWALAIVVVTAALIGRSR
jgi:hypothetical protein